MGLVKLSDRILRRSRASSEEPAGEQGAPASPGSPADAEKLAGAGGATVAQASAAEAEHEDAGKCPQCGAAMADGQQWCTQCGERSDGRLRKHAAWSSAGVLTIGSAILASGAAAAGVAALTQGSAQEPPHRSLIAQAPVTTSTTAAVPPAAGSPGSPETLKATSAAAPPPAATTATHSSSTASANAQGGTSGGQSANSGTGTGTSQSQRTTTSSSSASSEVPELQGLTASAYTLNTEYPKASLEGPENDPTRALEGRESGTSWTVQIKPGTAEHVNVGLQIALGGPTRVGSVEIHTSTPGFPLEIYGTASSQPPSTLSEWRRLAPPRG